MRKLCQLCLGIGLAALGLTLVAGNPPIQDPVKVFPKMYKVLLENDQVRVLEWRAAPGEKEAMHSHPAMVVYVLSGSKIRFWTPDGKSDELQSAPGTAIWREPITHATENLGPGDAHSILIELKTAKK